MIAKKKENAEILELTGLTLNELNELRAVAGVVKS